MLKWLVHLDRRYVFFFLFLAITASLLHPTKLHIAVEPSVQAAYNTLGQLKEGDKVLMAFDYGPSTMPEIHPAALAMMRQLFDKKVKIVMFTMWNEGLPMMDDAINSICLPLHEKEDVDYVNLGFKYGGLTGSSVIEGLGSDIEAVFPVTIKGTPYRDAPILKNVKNLADFKILITLSAGTPGIDEYIQYANARYHIPLVGAVSKVTAPKEFPFLQSGQLSGLCSGIVGSAEYEELVNHPGFGLTGLFAQSITHVMIIVFIVVGNLIYFSERIFKNEP